VDPPTILRRSALNFAAFDKGEKGITPYPVCSTPTRLAITSRLFDMHKSKMQRENQYKGSPHLDNKDTNFILYTGRKHYTRESWPSFFLSCSVTDWPPVAVLQAYYHSKYIAYQCLSWLTGVRRPNVLNK
jgi:hypothetical protein